MQPRSLSEYPYVRVRIRCPHCPKRRGVYALARLAERFGAEADLAAVLVELTRSCRYQVPVGTKRRQYVPYCRAYFPDLDQGGPPPDNPPDDNPSPAAPALRLVG